MELGYLQSCQEPTPYPVGSMGVSLCVGLKLQRRAKSGQEIKAWLLRFSGPKGPHHRTGRVQEVSQDLSSRHCVSLAVLYTRGVCMGNQAMAT